jgi:subtilisin family serine protease
MLKRSTRALSLAAIVAGLFYGAAGDAARLDPALSSRLGSLGAGRLEVIVSFPGNGAPTLAQRTLLATLGLKGVTLSGLPIAGVLANAQQIRALEARSDVRSVWYNAPLQYDNYEATALTGVDYLRADTSLRSQGLPYSGRGIGVLINDSGVDGLHPDVRFPNHLVQNVLAQTNLHSVDTLLPITWQEGVNNTDIGAGHGTHVSGIIGGNGAASTAGRFEGVAPGAKLVGYGSGAALFILDTLGGFDYALTHQAQYNIRVVSNSFGNTSDVDTDFNPDDPTNIATKALADRGVIVVFSAGNSGPGEATITGNFKKAPWVIAVAAGDKQGRLADFSSRGEARRGGTVQVDGEHYSWSDQPTVTAPGDGIYSARASTSDGLDLLGIQEAIDEIGPGQAVYYTKLSGTSMAAPHVSGIVALMLEANPAMTWREVKQHLTASATNIPGRETWEAGAGYANAHAAVRSALGAGRYGATLNANTQFNANAQTAVAGSANYSFQFLPVGPTGSVQFNVADDVSLVSARANVGDNTIALVLIDPTGQQYGSSIALPVLGENISVSAPGKAGTWTLTARGIGSVSGTAVDPARVTNGYGAPGTVDATVKQVRTTGFSGLNDINGHAGRAFIEAAVGDHLVDSDAFGLYHPDDRLNRGEWARFLNMGAAMRQSDPLTGPTFADVPASHPLYAYAEAVGAARGDTLRDTFYGEGPLLPANGGNFNADGAVSRLELAVVMIKALGLQSVAAAFQGEVRAAYNGKLYRVDDEAEIPPELRGYAQLALDLQLVPARFTSVQGPFDTAPNLYARFEPGQNVTRAFYAATAVRFLSAWQTP